MGILDWFVTPVYAEAPGGSDADAKDTSPRGGASTKTPASHETAGENDEEKEVNKADYKESEDDEQGHKPGQEGGHEAAGQQPEQEEEEEEEEPEDPKPKIEEGELCCCS